MTRVEAMAPSQPYRSANTVATVPEGMAATIKRISVIVMGRMALSAIAKAIKGFAISFISATATIRWLNFLKDIGLSMRAIARATKIARVLPITSSILKRRSKKVLFKGSFLIKEATSPRIKEMNMGDFRNVLSPEINEPPAPWPNKMATATPTVNMRMPTPSSLMTTASARGLADQ